MLKYLSLLFIFMTTFLYSDNTSFILNNKENVYDNFQLFYMEDENSNLNIKDIANKTFTKQTKNNFSLGYKKGSVWFKFTVKNNSSNKSFVLDLNESFYEVANLYYFESVWEKHTLSMYDPLNSRQIKSANLAFDITIPKNTHRVFYLELKGKYAYFGNIELSEKSSYYYKQSLGINTFLIFFLGIIFIIIFFTFFIYNSTKEKVYLYYLGFVFFNLIYYIKINGFLTYINLQKYVYELQFSAAFMIGFLILFSKEYLETKKYLKKVDRLLPTLSAIFFILGVLVVFSYQPWNKFINNFAGLICILLIIISSIIYFKGNSQVKYYIFAMMLYFVFVIIFTFMVNGTLEYTIFTRYGFIVSSVLEVIIFSFIVANRYNQIKNDIQNYLEYEVRVQTNKLNTLLKDRELLLKEIYHRVKNNFHMLIGMLHLENQKDNAQNKDFEGLINRVKSMSMIHEYLYSSKNISNIDIKEYFQEIISNVQKSYSNTNIDSQIENISINFDDALSIGIIINEILTNSIKHNEELDEINIKIKLQKKVNKIYLEILDNGKGFETNKKGLGLKLVNQFCKKLHEGKYKFSFEEGTKFSLEFKESTKNEL